ncbi:hypothetical protein LR48_Vigan01g251200 [Vigna angularis]|uniref:F-box/LRR-repeat protein 15-like leucin rich repeat domain-containing protein n=1 Tax=Phaseolus angularis TaxID=3914 RepID=A0A0L9TR56_PHAAN|nr:hypothetical protein LR48_Vigan01g251200 [Vigna angularis]
MGGICSRKRDQHVVEDDLHRGISGRYCRSGNIKWSRSRSLRSKSNQCPGWGTCPSLMDLCINRIREDIDLGEYSGVDDNWMDVISSQGLSLLSVDVSGSQVTDNGLRLLKDCSNLQALTLNYCDQFSEYGLKHISGLSKLDSLSIRKSSSVKPDGMRAFSNLFLIWRSWTLRGLKKLEFLNIGCCKCVTDSDIKSISELINLKELHISNSSITDIGISYLRGLEKLTTLNVEGCNITGACLESIHALASLACLNLSRCGLSNDGFEKIAGLKSLKRLSLAFNRITDASLVHLKGT